MDEFATSKAGDTQKGGWRENTEEEEAKGAEVRAALKEKKRLQLEEYKRLEASSSFVNSYCFMEKYKSLIRKYRSEDYASETDKAFHMLALLKEITAKDWEEPIELMNCAEQMLAEMKAQFPHEYTGLNMLSRWKKNLLDEYMSCIEPQFSTGHTATVTYYRRTIHMVHNAGVVAVPEVAAGAGPVTGALRRELLKIMVAWEAEMVTMYQSMRQEGARALLVKSPVVVTMGYSVHTARMLDRLARTRHVRVRVLETRPLATGYYVLDDLEEMQSVVAAEVVPDTCAEPHLAGATAVLVPAVAVLPSGHVVAPAGAAALVVLAKRRAVPVMVIAPMFLFHSDEEEFPNVMYDPRTYHDEPELYGTSFESYMFDVIPAENITTYITENGCKSLKNIGYIHADLYGSRFVQLEDRNEIKLRPKKKTSSKKEGNDDEKTDGEESEGEANPCTDEDTDNE